MNQFKTFYNISETSYTKLRAEVHYFLLTDEISSIIALLKNKYTLFYVGKMSKLLFAFDYKDLFVVKYVDKTIKVQNTFLEVSSGVSLLELGNYAIKNGIAGFEKIMTIPGNVGGSIINNASFLDQGINDNLLFLQVIDSKGNIKTLKKDDLDINYRRVNFKEENIFIYRAYFKIERKLRYELYQSKKKSFSYRFSHQSSKLSFGSTFKNYKQYKAYELINKYIDFRSQNGVKISSKHANFLEFNSDEDYINIVKIIERVQEVLYNKLGFYLESEIKIIY